MAEVKYRDLKAELDLVLVQLQDFDIDIDDAVRLHKKGLKLVKQLEQYLKKISEETV